jgi:bifunctional non-homologous end joining protein LigD
VFWPEEGYTKGDLIDYYAQAAEALLPYLAGRPVHLLRYPDGITGKSFYQRRAPDFLPEWVQTVPVDIGEEHAVPHLLCGDRRTLLYLVNLGSIDLHPWLSGVQHPGFPDWAVLDLDAKEAGFEQVVTVARAAGRLLRGLGLRPYLKTSGASGAHVYIPLTSGHTYEQSRLFCEAVARLLVREHPRVASAEREPRARRGKVYVDFLQNRRAATVVPPYVVRPLPGAPVSMPLDWDELSRDLDPRRFSLDTALPRLEALGDPFHATLTDRQRLEPAIAAMQRLLGR